MWLTKQKQLTGGIFFRYRWNKLAHCMFLTSIKRIYSWWESFILESIGLYWLHFVFDSTQKKSTHHLGIDWTILMPLRFLRKNRLFGNVPEFLCTLYILWRLYQHYNNLITHTHTHTHRSSQLGQSLCVGFPDWSMPHKTMKSTAETMSALWSQAGERTWFNTP